MLQDEVQTIVAQATPPGYGGVGVIRVSGPQSAAIAARMLGKIPEHRVAAYGPFLDADKAVLDQGIALFFKAPHSFTGEDVLELQGHGGPVVMEALIQTALVLGARLAEPGEFSLRAFLNNKIDLLQAEAVSDLIHAHSLQAARGAMRSLQGDFSNAVQEIVEDLIQVRMFIESMIDFSEEDLEFIHAEEMRGSIAQLKEKIERLIHQAQQGVLITRGSKVMIMGTPNAGKSSLLNALSQQNMAIVTDIPGTTRDMVRSSIRLEGMVMDLMDTAGIRKTEDPIEKEGIRRALEAAALADHIIWVVDVSEAFSENPLALLEEHGFCFKEGVGLTVLYNKMDLQKEKTKHMSSDHFSKNQSVLYVSVKTGDGLEAFQKHLKKVLGLDGVSDQAFSARARHIEGLQEAQSAITRAAEQSWSLSVLELVAEDLKEAQKALEVITGRFTPDDLLSKIFSTFCIGK